jgi:hypothetical protein
MDIQSALNENESRLLKLANVTGTGIGEKNGEEVIIVFVTKKLPEAVLHSQDIVPKHIGSFPTDVREQIKVGE